MKNHCKEAELSSYYAYGEACILFISQDLYGSSFPKMLPFHVAHTLSFIVLALQGYYTGTLMILAVLHL